MLFLELFKLEKRQNMHSVVSYKWKKRGKRGEEEDLQWVAVWDIFRERERESTFL